MTAHFASPSQISHWNEHVLANPDSGNVFQGVEFAEQKKLGGWTPRFVMIDKLAVTVLEKPIIGLGKLWYIPKGPGVTSVRELDNILSELQQFAAQNGVFAVKIEPELYQKRRNTGRLNEIRPRSRYTDSTKFLDSASPYKG